MTKKRNHIGVYQMYINGKLEDLYIDGDGWEQIETFKKIAGYSKSHKFEIKHATLPGMVKMRKQDVISAVSDKYEIVVIKSYVADAKTIFFAPDFRVQIHDKRTKEVKTYMGTMAGFMYNLFEKIQGIQK